MKNAAQATAILFLDVSGSTRFLERHGDVAGREMIEACFSVIRPAVERNGGRIVKPLGDGLLTAFPTAEGMVRGAVDAHLDVADARRRIAKEPVSLHSGGDLGLVVTGVDDVFGDAVNVAARVNDMAGRDRIYVTANVAAALPAGLRDELRRIGRFPLHGRQGEVDVYEVLWRMEGATLTMPGTAPSADMRCLLEVGEKKYEIRQPITHLTLGRVADNDITVDDAAASRHHAEVVFRRNLFYLVDRSTNGTYLRPGRRLPRHLHHTEYPLEGEGTFALGRPDGPPVQYRVTTSSSHSHDDAS